MENLWQTAFSSIPHFLHGATASERADQQRVDDTIDRLVDDSDPRLHLISSYRRQLRAPMEHALEHIDQLVERIPGPVEVCARAFSSDPQVTAFFTNIDELRRVYCSSEAIRKFFAAPEFGDADECHALLCMARDEKQVFGVGLEGGSVRRDIPQTLVNFGGHQLLSPSPDEQHARQTLRHCLLGALLRQAGSGLVSGISERRALQSRQHQLYNHLRALRQRPDTEQQQAETGKALAAVEQDLKKLQSSLGDINGHLKTLIQGLEQAPDAIQVESCELRISRTHVKLGLEQQRDGILLSLAEVHLGQEPPKVVSLTRYPRSEFQPATATHPPPLLPCMGQQTGYVYGETPATPLAKNPPFHQESCIYCPFGTQYPSKLLNYYPKPNIPEAKKHHGSSSRRQDHSTQRGRLAGEPGRMERGAGRAGRPQ